MARLMAAAFMRGGQCAAHACKHPRWTTAQWVHDPFCYEAAVTAVVEALRALKPVGFERIIGEAPVWTESMGPKPEEFESMLGNAPVGEMPMHPSPKGKPVPLPFTALVVDESGIVRVAPVATEREKEPKQ
jgi:hypothetical protein